MRRAGGTSGTRRGAAARLLASVLLVAGGAACTRGSAAVHGRIVAIHERDFKLSAGTDTVPAGLVTFRVHNTGPSTHELNLVRTDAMPDDLPLRPNGLTVDENSHALHLIDSVDDVRMGATKDLTVDLEPGHYVLYCNLEGHYLGGMYVEIEVTA